MKTLKVLSLWFVMGTLLFWIGCGESKLDISSEKTFAASLEKIYKSIPEGERETFRDYLNLTMHGKVPALSTFFGGKRDVPSYEDLIQMYSMTKAFGSEKDMKLFGNINGLTRSDITSKGKAILKEDLEEHLTGLDKQIEVVKKQVEENRKKAEGAKKFSEELTKVSIELGAVEVAEAQYSSHKGQVGFVSLAVTIINDSSETLHGFKDGRVTFTDGNGKEVDGGNMADLNEFVADDTSRPFSNSYSSPGLAAGKTITGRLAKKFGWLTPDFPYPPRSEFKATLKESPLKPILDGKKEWTEFDALNAKQSDQKLEKLNEEKAHLQAELAQIM